MPDPSREPGRSHHLIEDGTISGRIAKDVLREECTAPGRCPGIVGREGLTQVADAGELSAVVDQVLAEHAKVVEELEERQEGRARLPGRAGDEGHGGQGQPAVVNSLLDEKLPKV